MKPILSMRAGTVGAFALMLATLVGCSEASESDVRATLTRYFSLGETVYFQARYDCTAGMFKVQTDEMKSALRVNRDAGSALFEYGRSGVLALADATQTPNDGFLELMNADRTIGVAMQSASVIGKGCMDAATESGFFYAMSNPNASMIFLRDEAAMILIDPQTRLVIYASEAG